MKHRYLKAALALVLLAGLPTLASAVRVRTAASQRELRHVDADGRLVVDLWTDRGDGAVYHVGDPIRVYFRCSTDAYVVLYNVDTQGRVHLLYPYRRGDPHYVQGGREYQLPGSSARYDLVVDGPPGVEYVQALASREPFQQLPDYLDPDGVTSDFDPLDPEWRDGGTIVGDPFLGMERINRAILPYDCDEEDCFSASYASFYVERKVPYPRYVCADCHGPFADALYDPYATRCSVFDIRVDYDWRWRRHFPFYRQPYWYYFRRADVAPRFYGYKQRWSSRDGWVRFRYTFGERVLWKKNPGPDRKAGGGGYFRGDDRRGQPPPAAPSAPGGGARMRDEWRRRRFHPEPVPQPTQLAPGGEEAKESAPIRFRSRSREIPPAPRTEPKEPPAPAQPPPGQENAPPPDREGRRETDRHRGEGHKTPHDEGRHKEDKGGDEKSGGRHSDNSGKEDHGKSRDEGESQGRKFRAGD